MSKNSAHDELVGGGLSNGPYNLLRMAGGWGSIGGPGIFMIRSLTSGTLTSIFTGMTGAIISAMLYDTAGLPFVICSCAGFIIGCAGFYRDAVRKSLLYLDRYPRLLQLHLDASFPSQRFNSWSLDRMNSANFRSWHLRSMLAVAWLNAIPAIETIVDNDEQAIVEVQASLDKTEHET